MDKYRPLRGSIEKYAALERHRFLRQVRSRRQISKHSAMLLNPPASVIAPCILNVLRYTQVRSSIAVRARREESHVSLTLLYVQIWEKQSDHSKGSCLPDAVSS